LIKIIAAVVPILNGRDSSGNIIHMGPHMTKIPRYLLVVFLAKSSEMFRLAQGRPIDSSIYFTIYGLGEVAAKFKQFGPYHQAIHYDRTKVAGRVYTMISNKDLVTITKKEGETYVTITEKGEGVSKKLIQEFKEIADLSESDTHESYIAKGVKSRGLDLQGIEKRLTEKIADVNSQFADELKTIEED